jgi:probable F420-dependent oxidoreductase
MRFGVAFPTGMEGLYYRPPFVSPECFVDIAQAAEALGYDAVWPNDHITTQAYVRAAFNDTPNYYDPLITLAHVAARTRHLRFGTGLAVLPLRDPVILAKQAATLDVLSGGRFMLGVGLGAYREEYRAASPRAGAPPRGALLDERLAALRVLFDEPRASFAGTYVEFSGIELTPRPAQHPFPLLVGGNDDRVLRRVARWGTGWYPACLTPAEMKEKLGRLATFAIEEGRGGVTFDVPLQLIVSMADTQDKALANLRASHIYQHILSLSDATLRGQALDSLVARNLIGSPDDIVETLRRYADAGVTHLGGCVFLADTVGQLIAHMEEFAKRILVTVA